MDDFAIENQINQLSSRDARLIALDKLDPQYAKVRSLFMQGWKHKRKRPLVLAVYKIAAPQASIQPYVDYKSKVQGDTDRQVEELLFHGTTRACKLGENPNSVLLCSLPACSLCAIIRKSFDMKFCGNKNKFNRFGKGIYTSSCSSKADDYVSNVSSDATCRVLLLNRVVVGRSKRLRFNSVDMTQPPYGFDSVLGQPGADLNYQETVVYTNNAIRPSYLVVYGEKLVHPEAKSMLEAVIRQMFFTPLTQ